MKLFNGKKQWVFLIVAVALVIFVFFMYRGVGRENAKSIEPPVEKDRASAVMVREMDMTQKAKEAGKPVWTEGTAETLAVSAAIPKIVKPVALPVKMVSTKTPTAQAAPVRITRVKTY